MDEQRFDDLVKRVATTSRRQILHSLLGGLAAAIGTHGVDAARKRQKQQDTAKESDKKPSAKRQHKPDRKQEVRAAAKGKAKKCGGRVCETGTTCVSGGGKPVCCPNARVCGQACLGAPCAAPCQNCDPAAGVCVNTTASCDDGDPCTTNDQCRNGSCVGEPVTGCLSCEGDGDCSAITVDQCHEAVCGAGGTCIVQNVRNDTSCGEGHICCGGSCVPNTTSTTCSTCRNSCSTGQSCVNGACVTNICPAEPQGCCYCNYQDAAGNFIGTCDITSDCGNCAAICQANTPPGTTQVGGGVACPSALPSGAMYICIPTNSPPNITGFACGSAPCAPAGT
jgi:hypothetical protein